MEGDGGRITAVAWLPAAPVVVPEIGGVVSADVDLARLRQAVAAAVAEVVATAPASVTVIAPTTAAITAEPPATWSWHGFGVGESPDAARPTLPWQLGLGARLLDDAGWRGGRRYLGVTGRAECGDAPAAWEATGLLVLGDGSACRGPHAPGGHDPRAGDWDKRLAEVLAGGDPAELAGLDPVVGAELMSAAAVTFPAAGALLSGAGTPRARGSVVMYDAAPYGVGYLVAAWTW